MSEVVPRYYQEDQISKTVQAIVDGHNPICASPTASGKSIVLCGIIDELISQFPKWNILVLSHVEEILEQNHAALENYFNIDIGLYSAGLGSREIKKITVASIQSANANKTLFEEFDIVLVDEAHRVGYDKKTSYRKFVKHIDAQAAGLTATHYRTKGGYLHEAEDSLFDYLASDWTQLEKFNQLTEDGFLSEIYSKKTLLKMDVKGIKTLGGDFKSKDLSAKFDRDNITEAAIIESIHFGRNYKKWLCFAIDIHHANTIAERLNAHGISAVAVHSEMEQDRKQVIRDFKNGKYRCLVNVEVLTTGFNDPEIDMIIMLRPTKSPIIHVQTIGRGLRVVYADGYDLETKEGRLAAIEAGPKQHCLVLDFAGNTARLGPINDVKINGAKKGKGTGEAMTRCCPECDIENHLAARVCCNCGYEFPREEKLSLTASMDDVVKREKEELKIIDWANVDKVSYSIHRKPGKPNCLKVRYKCGLIVFNEYILIEGTGYARHKANNWLRYRWNSADVRIPKTVEECIAGKQYLNEPKRILVDCSSRFPKIVDSEF